MEIGLTGPGSPPLRYQAHAGFVQLLEAAGCSLAISVYLSGRVVLVSAENRKLVIETFEFARPMGIATRVVDGTLQLALATFQEVVVFADAPLLAPSLPEAQQRYRHLLVPRATYYTSDIDAHDLSWAGESLCTANTRFCCIAGIDDRYSFTPLWRPPFVTAVMPDDRCHLNGFAVADGRVAYATAFAPSDAPRGWSDTRLDSGLLMEVPSGRVVMDHLCMPHSPRVFDGVLHVLDSGTGRVLRVDGERREPAALAELPGFTRGFDRLDDILFVGLSRLRHGGNRPQPPVAARYPALTCGVAAIDRRTGRLLGVLKLDDSYEEVFDVKVLPNFSRGGILSPLDGRLGKALTLPGRAFWAGEVPRQ